MCPLLMMHKTCSINYGHLADLQKTLPTTDLNKIKTFSFDKMSPRDFYFFPFFSICTCWLIEMVIFDIYGEPLSIECIHTLWQLTQIIVNMMTSSNGNIFRVTGLLCGDSPVTGEFPPQRPVTRCFDGFFDLRLNKRLGKQSIRRWFETPSL